MNAQRTGWTRERSPGLDHQLTFVGENFFSCVPIPS